MIHFNKSGNEERPKVKPLTLEEEKEVISFLNAMIDDQETKWKARPVAREQLLQRLIYNYENLCHYKAYTSGNTEAQDKFFE